MMPPPTKVIAVLMVWLCASAQGCTRAGSPDVTAPPVVQLYAFDGGSTFIPDKSMFHAAYAGQGAIRLPVTAFLIVHPRGTLVWDTGHSDSFARPGAKVPDRYLIRVEKTLVEQMQTVGITPAEVDYLAFSHWHFDHTGNANLFTRATIIGQRDEWEYAFSPDAETGFGMKPDTYEALRDNPTDLFVGDRDVFGDGTVRIVRVGGHTIGSQVLVVRLADRVVVLSGDIYHFAGQRTHQRVPPFNHDYEQTLAGMRRVEDLLASITNARLWITHDPEQMAQLRYAPEVYR
ncbi:MAG: N-acyl homoserine lactonase family protein [Planctomycetes bacterium]|nr:N-acyl homoserine lactonase family protein [Planctomycetota bacterium]